MQPAMQDAFSSLPTELFLNILNQLVGTRDGCQPIAYAASDPITKTLRTLTLVSRGIYPVASQFLYGHCLYLDNCRNYSQFRRTLGLGLGHHPDALQYGQAGRNEKLFAEAKVTQHITSLFLSPQKTNQCGNVPMIRLPQIIDLCNTIGSTLKRLAMDLQPIYASASEIEAIKPHISTNNIFLSMTKLEDLVCSFDITDYFPSPPPNLKRLAITSQFLNEPLLRFCLSTSSLETLFLLRRPELKAADINKIFQYYHGRHLDVILVDVSANHRTPDNTRDWQPDDRVAIHELDVPKSYYGDEDDLILCDSWIWNQAVRGTLWNSGRRRMNSWSEVQAEVASTGALISSSGP
ncbi:hypothetical protein CC78DRAFT_187640 [Lojkania enalia]|uniref:F-box domain-containing protein n=1 Tax=Lojkania enalia TaxID=147567 RepID=A0A9P4JV40_9PLEO|nr:hypothetical protein CC78DRAFT_187640 [Didymosphaeria enalia]